MTDFPEFNPEDIEKTEIVEHPPAANERSSGRRMALQILYEVDSTHHALAEVTAVRLQANPISKRAQRYVRNLVNGVYDNRVAFDALIQRYASEFPIGQMAIIDRNILRLGLYEIAARPTVSISVIIDEAMELANLFGAEGSTRFVNGVLGKLAAEDYEVIRQILPPEPESEN